MAAVQKEFPNGSVKPVEISEEEFEGLREAQEVFRDLAARMRAFALNERLALWFVQWRYDPWEASEALFQYSTHVRPQPLECTSVPRKSNRLFG